MTFKQAKIDNHRTLNTVDVNFTMDINKNHRKKGILHNNKAKRTENFTTHKESHYKDIVCAYNN